MAWQDRLREAAYTAPDGTRASFAYEDVRRIIEKKTTSFEFPDADGTFVQDLGTTGRRYPLRLFFWGEDYDQEAEAFEALLTQRGAGKLDHPIYGSVDVVPFGQITRRDDLKTAANQAVIELTFWETTGLVYPTAQADPGGAVAASVSEFNDAAAGEFEETADVSTVGKRLPLKNLYSRFLEQTASILESVAGAEGGVESRFDTIKTSIDNGLDVLVNDPLTLAYQTALFIQEPGRAASEITTTLESYGELIGLIVDAVNGPDTPNSLRLEDLYGQAYVTGSIVAAANSDFATKTEAIGAAETILGQFSDLVAWRDAEFDRLNEIDTGEAYQKLLASVTTTAGFLVELSFSLKQERRIVLDRARTVIDLTAELYGEVDEQFDFFITSNNLSGDEYFELPAGREIVYYV